MRNVYCVGETVYDIIFKNEKPVEAKPGGAMLNTAVSLGRLGIPVALVGDFANDKIGDIICDFLRSNNVSTQYVTRYDDGKSRIALAFLDDNNNASYSFYKIRKEGKAKITCPEVKQDDIILFGSFYGIKEEIRDELVGFLKFAIQQNAIIVFDPNFRNAHKGILNEVIGFINENIVLADIVKGSDEDFANIYNSANSLEAWQKIRAFAKPNFIYTANKYGVTLYSQNIEKHYDVPQFQPLSTIGAGDTFNAGIIYGLIKHNILHADLQNISENTWNLIIQTAIEFATDVCLSYDNYLSAEFCGRYENLSIV